MQWNYDYETYRLSAEERIRRAEKERLINKLRKQRQDTPERNNTAQAQEHIHELRIRPTAQ